MLPSRERAEELLREAEQCNLGPWGAHCRIAARCAEKIAGATEEMDADKAYVLGLLHDIGRKFGIGHLRHVVDGYSYMNSLGYDEVAQVCLTHSFSGRTVDDYIGDFDATKEEEELIREKLWIVEMDQYDELIQLCDALAGTKGALDVEERMMDVENRYGSYPQCKWDHSLELKKQFEEKTGLVISKALLD